MWRNWLRKFFFHKVHNGVTINHQWLTFLNSGSIFSKGKARLGYGNFETSEFFRSLTPSYLKNTGTIELGNDVTISSSFKILNKGTLKIGDQTYINPNSIIRIENGLTIGNDCAISWGVTMMDHDAHEMEGKREARPINIGNHVWIGANATILKGVTIGDGCVVAAGAVVSKSFGPNQLIGGVPARMIKENIEWKK